MSVYIYKPALLCLEITQTSLIELMFPNIEIFQIATSLNNNTFYS